MKRGRFRLGRAQSIVSLRRVLLWSVQMLLLWKSTFSVIILAFFVFRRLIVISRREVLKTLYSILFIVAEVESKTILCTIFKRLIGSVPIGEGPRDVSQWRGWTSLSTSFLWLFDSVLVFPTSVISFFFQIVLEHRASLFCYEKLAERSTESFAVKCLDVVAVEVDIFCYNFSFLCPLKANCNFQKRSLEDFVQHSIRSCWSWFQNHFCTILKPLIGSVPIGEGPEM